MSKVKIIFALSIWVIILPFLGFPDSLQDVLFSTTGLVLVYFSYVLYKNLKVGETEKKNFDNFSENSDFNEDKINSEEKIDLK
ncbi:hypothetical protein CO033_02775 [Candidatus Nomurabacteria bacterium CG_4_9_14_0_2_um_filter_32_10]|uniref:Uncharacterized protein n=2 Tax=Candidatus Nomuraibacteriota TaxID=1752729 RepID=A0A2H0CGI0_9BACT|nr:MAG: hypothetical protein COW91_01760 [Candidatus Nomurabacteria bacterium CG22_combo_CG10-13_8_21_14_all_32_8]PJC49203.1 MAG: hypothetical protein CO033_02775 [Candidatus Nomurabacteria bacterium CG_4_9_14_0_2_um_filter_32_10]